MIAAITPLKIRRRTRAAVSAVLVVSAMVISIAPTDAASRTPYDRNLVKNSSFEIGSASADGSNPVAIPDWTTTGNTTVVAYGTPGFPRKSASRPFHGRDQFLTLGAADAGGSCGQAVQTVTLRGLDADIDGSAIRVWFKARLGTSSAEPDEAKISYRFLPAPSAGNSSMDGHVTTEDTFILEGQSQILPPGTRSIQIVVYADNTNSTCSAYYDKVKLILLHAG